MSHAKLIFWFVSYSFDIRCLAETHWLGQGIRQITDWSIAFSGSDNGIKRQGVGIAINPAARHSFICAEAISEGVLVAHFASRESICRDLRHMPLHLIMMIVSRSFLL